MKFLKIAAVTIAALTTVQAHAATFAYALTGDYAASWTMDSNPVTGTVTTDWFEVQNVVGTYQGTSSTLATITFFTGDFGGGLQIDAPNYLLATDGPQLYSGTNAAPTMLTGVFPMTQYLGSGKYTLTVTDVSAAVPEPATWAMMIVGFGLAGAALRRRATVAATA